MIRWTALVEAAPAEEALLGGIRSTLEAGGEAPPAWELKRTRLERHVWRVAGAGAVLYVKLQLYRSFRVRFRYALRPPPTLTEGRNALRMARLGLRVPVPLAHGVEGAGPGRRRSVLITREAVGEPAAAAVAAGRLSLADLAGVLGDLGRAGVRHPDLHLNNLLLGPEGPVVLDLQSVRFNKGPLPDPVLFPMAVKLGMSLEERQLADLATWAEALLEAGFALGKERLAASLQDHAESIAYQDLKSRIRRCLVNSSGFVVERRKGLHLFRRRETDGDRIAGLVNRALLTTSGETTVTIADHACFLTTRQQGRKLWLSARRQELTGRHWGFLDWYVGRPGEELPRVSYEPPSLSLDPPLALACRGFGPWARACLVFPANTHATDILRWLSLKPAARQRPSAPPG